VSDRFRRERPISGALAPLTSNFRNWDIPLKKSALKCFLLCALAERALFRPALTLGQERASSVSRTKRRLNPMLGFKSFAFNVVAGSAYRKLNLTDSREGGDFVTRSL
jgi:hypothetical protein